MKRFVGILAVLLALAISAIGVFAQESTPEPVAPAEAPESAPLLGIRYDPSAGAVTIRVVRNTPAEEAGLQDGDIITAVNGDDVTGATMADAVSAFAPGDEITLTVSRGDETLDIPVTLGNAADYNRAPGGRPSDNNGRGMFELRMMDDVLTLNADGNLEVVDAPEDSILAQAGLQAGDVITAINGNALSEGDFMPNLRDFDGTLTLTVERDGETLDLDIDMEAMPMMLLQMLQGIHGDMPFDFNFEMPDGAPFGGQGQTRNRVLLGVQFVQLTAENAADFNTDLTEGAYIVSVIDSSPADTAGLLAGDIVTAVDGTPVDATRNLADKIRELDADATFTLTVVRDGETLELTVHLGVMNAESTPPINTSLG